MPACKLSQMEQIQKVVAVTPEARLTIVATLNDVQRDAGQDESGLSGHDPRNEDTASRVD